MLTYGVLCRCVWVCGLFGLGVRQVHMSGTVQYTHISGGLLQVPPCDDTQTKAHRAFSKGHTRRGALGGDGWTFDLVARAFVSVPRGGCAAQRAENSGIPVLGGKKEKRRVLEDMLPMRKVGEITHMSITAGLVPPSCLPPTTNQRGADEDKDSIAGRMMMVLKVYGGVACTEHFFGPQL